LFPVIGIWVFNRSSPTVTIVGVFVRFRSLRRFTQ
jgi:hypothetical protein